VKETEGHLKKKPSISDLFSEEMISKYRKKTKKSFMPTDSNNHPTIKRK
jgi:hypothetical protein